MQGRADVVQLLLKEDRDGLVRKALAEEEKAPPSVVNLALANDFIECAEWSVFKGSSHLFIYFTAF